jgi:sulfite exporter TauE/SafE
MTAVLAGFLLGLAGSVHCAAMCGPLVGLVAPAFGRRITSGLWYQAGRIATYVMLGGLAGLTGAAARLAGAGRGVSIAAGLLMVATALGFVFGRQVRLGAWWTHRLTRALAGAGELRRSHPAMGAMGAGLINGALPCGLVYAAALAATTTGHPVQGAAVLLAFGLGTVPAMLGMWSAAAYLPAAVRQRLRVLTPAALLVVGVLLIMRGLTIAAAGPHH